MTWSLLSLAVFAAAPDFVLVRDGKPEATVVVAAKPTLAAAFAAQELRDHVRLITGATLPMVHDQAQVTGKRILVGDSTATKALGLDGATMPPQEGLIAFRGDTLVLLGRDAPQEVADGIALRGETQRAEGRLGSGLSLAGKGAVRVDDPGFSDDEGTLECWVSLTAEPQPKEATLLRLDGSDPWTYHILRRVDGTQRIMYVTYDGTNGHSVTSGDLAPGWHYVAGVYSAAERSMELFIDGVSAGRTDYVKTTCHGAVLGIGGIATGDSVGNPLTGSIDEVRLSTVRRSIPAGGPTAACQPDAGTAVLLHFDEAESTPHDASGRPRHVAPPDWTTDQATSYATHDFLERYCDVRWFAPGEAGISVVPRTTLAVAARDLRRSPAIRHRTCWPPYGYGLGKVLWDNASQADCRLYFARLKAGGEPYACNHSFYGYYDRFWQQNPDRPDVFEAAHPDWSAQGYQGKPPQMCFSNQGFIDQVVKDANAYFDGQGSATGAQASGDYFGLVPMDNNQWCQCPTCQARLDHAEDSSPHFSNGRASDYFFTFANQVAREVAKTHPDKWLSTIAYYEYAYYPKHTRLEPNLSVQMCLHVRNWWAPDMERNDLAFYHDWVTKEPGRPLFLWLYYCFPEEIATNGGWHCFPGFFAHTLDRQIKMFAKDGIRGAFLNGLGEQVDTYLTFKLFDDPTQNVDTLLDEFFTRWYGAAAEPMKQLYLRIEQLYSDPANYPDSIQHGKGHQHQTEELAWGAVGTAEHMAELGRLMDQAKAAVKTDLERHRVDLFDQGIWQYMLAGHEAHAAREAQVPEIERLKSQPPPSVTVPNVAAAGGDVAKVDWAKATLLDHWYGIEGYATERKPAARLAHDAEYLYVELSEPVATANLVSQPDIWSGDDWEVFVAAQRAKPYSQLGVAPNGKWTVGAAASPEWGKGVQVVSDTSGAEGWTVRLALPLRGLVPGGVKPGGSCFANFYRASPGARELLAWSPNFKATFHEASRLGELRFE